MKLSSLTKETSLLPQIETSRESTNGQNDREQLILMLPTQTNKSTKQPLYPSLRKYGKRRARCKKIIRTRGPGHPL